MAGPMWSSVTVFSLLLFLTAMAVLPRGLRANGYSRGWIAGHATWYGDPHGEGSSGTSPHNSSYIPVLEFLALIFRLHLTLEFQ